MTIPLQNDAWYHEHIRNADIKEVSKNSYIFQINDFVQSVQAQNIHDLITHPKKYNKKLKNIDRELNTKHTFLGAVYSLLKHTNMKNIYPRLDLTWKNEGKYIVDQFHSQIMSNVPTEKQQLSNYPWNTVLQIRDALPYGSIDHLILSLYTYVPPRRQWDYYKLKVYNDPKTSPQLDHNHLHTYSESKNTSYIFLNEYKTSNYYHNFMNTDIPSEFLNVIKASLQKYPREYLFQKENGQPYDNTNSFQKRINRRLKNIFNNDQVTVNSLRHSFSTLLKTIPDLPLSEWECYAKKMGNSVLQVQQYSFVNAENKNTEQPNNTMKDEQFLKNKPVYKRVGNTLIRIKCP